MKGNRKPLHKLAFNNGDVWEVVFLSHKHKMLAGKKKPVHFFTSTSIDLHVNMHSSHACHYTAATFCENFDCLNYS